MILSNPTVPTDLEASTPPENLNTNASSISGARARRTMTDHQRKEKELCQLPVILTLKSLSDVSDLLGLMLSPARVSLLEPDFGGVVEKLGDLCPRPANLDLTQKSHGQEQRKSEKSCGQPVESVLSALPCMTEHGAFQYTTLQAPVSSRTLG